MNIKIEETTLNKKDLVEHFAEFFSTMDNYDDNLWGLVKDICEAVLEKHDIKISEKYAKKIINTFSF